MPGPLRIVYFWPGLAGERAFRAANIAQIIRQDPLKHPGEIIAKHEMRVWFEPNWHDARLLARRFPHCLICSIPTESDTESLRRVPDWRPRRTGGVL